MSENSTPLDEQNSESLHNLAVNLLKNIPGQSKRIESLEELVNLVVEDNLRKLQLPTFATKIESAVEISLDQNDTQHLDVSNEDLWIFGYGSLVWKADFPYVSRRIGWIQGFERRFYQNSIDHRGTIEKPGRVVTLIPSSAHNSKVWGVAYRISAGEREDVIKHLDYREKNGYQRYSVQFHPYSPDHGTSFSPQDIVMYIATEKNESYAGHIDDLDDIANQIYWAVGPSGTNREYVYKLANAMRKLFPGEQDGHLFALEAKLREKEAREMELRLRLKAELTPILQKAMEANQMLGNYEILVRNKFEEFQSEFSHL